MRLRGPRRRVEFRCSWPQAWSEGLRAVARVSVRSRGPQYRVQGLILMQRVHQLMRVVYLQQLGLGTGTADYGPNLATANGPTRATAFVAVAMCEWQRIWMP